MGFLSSLRKGRLRRSAAFPGADIGRLTSSWTTDPGAINRWLRYELRTLRARSRQLARGDAYGSKFIRACVDNIAGPNPFCMESKAQFKNGTFNTTANTAIENAWYERVKAGNFDVTGKLSMSAAHRLVVRCLARDGEVLIRKIKGSGAGYNFGAVGRWQILDVDRLDEQKNDTLPGGRTIKMGVELDLFSRPIAYHLLRQHPGEMGEWNRGVTRDYERVPAEQIYHLFIADWPEQVRGFPWMHAAMVRLWNLGSFEDAAVINARIGASKVAVIEGPESDQGAIEAATGKDSRGNLLADVEPGTYWTLPGGHKLNSFDPSFPDEAVEPFIKACLRGAASAVGMAYHSLANDAGEVNFTQGRIALQEERDHWMSIQDWYVEHLCQPDGVDWLRGAVSDGIFKIDYTQYAATMFFQPRRWQWIDPQSEVEAEVLAIENKLKSRTQSIRERGGDVEETFDELAAEEALAKEKGITLPAPKEQPNGKQPTKPVDEAETAEPRGARARAEGEPAILRQHRVRPRLN